MEVRYKKGWLFGLAFCFVTVVFAEFYKNFIKNSVTL
jgi:hypothetical protein